MYGFRARVKKNKRNIYYITKNPKGPTGRHIDALGRQIVPLAKSFAHKRTGLLAKSIRMRHIRSATGEVGVSVYSKRRYAHVHHEGAKPHRITPRKPGGVLRFRGKKGIVYAAHVNHPGHRGNPYLRRALEIVILR